MRIEIISERQWGQPKLIKPKILKGVKQIGNAVWIPKKCTCPVYVVGVDVYVLHRDWFSKEFMHPDSVGMPLNDIIQTYFPEIKSKSEKFIYGDGWGSVVLRNEAWLKICGMFDVHDYYRPRKLCMALSESIGVDWYSDDFDYCHWLRFFESVCSTTNKMLIP